MNKCCVKSIILNLIKFNDVGRDSSATGEAGSGVEDGELPIDSGDHDVATSFCWGELGATTVTGLLTVSDGVDKGC